MRLEPELRQTRRFLSRTFLGFAVFMLLTFLVVNLTAIIAYAVSPHLEFSALSQIVLSMVSMYLVAMPIGFLLWRRCPASPPEQHPMRVYQIALAFVMAMSLLYLGSWTGMGIEAIVEAASGRSSDNLVSDLLGESSIWSNLIFTVLIGPALEELLFRKVLIDRVRKHGDWLAIWASGIAFGLFHGNIYQFFFAAAIGVLFAFIYCRTGRLRYSIILHMLVNSMGAFFLPLLLETVSDETIRQLESVSVNDPAFSELFTTHFGEIMVYAGMAMAILLVVISGVVLLIVNRKRFTCPPAEQPLPQGRRFRILALNPGILLFALICLGEIVLTFFT